MLYGPDAVPRGFSRTTGGGIFSYAVYNGNYSCIFGTYSIRTEFQCVQYLYLIDIPIMDTFLLFLFE